MTRPRHRVTRARRGDIGLVMLPSGYWAIRWGRKLSRQACLPLSESTQTRDRADAQGILDRRRVQVFRSLGDEGSVREALRKVHPIPLPELGAEFLRAYSGGLLDGRAPGPGTVELALHALHGKRGGMLVAAAGMGRVLSSEIDAVFIRRWLVAESRRLAPDSIRLKLACARRVVAFAVSRGYVTEETLVAVKAIRPPPSAKGRAESGGVPSEVDLRRVLEAMKPRYAGNVRPRSSAQRAYRPTPYHLVAELQLRLGLRRAEVIALDATWLDELAGRVRVRVSETFDTKSHSSRTIDGVDADTFVLAREVVAVKQTHRVTISGYKEAWKRACERVERAGHPWTYRSKSHALRAAYATASRAAGIPLSIVRDRLGHSSERVTERHYLGRTSEVVAGPFAGKALMGETTPPSGATVLPFPAKVG